MKQLNYVSGKCPKLLNKYLAATREEIIENKKKLKSYNKDEAKFNKKKKKEVRLKYEIVGNETYCNQPRIVVQYLISKIKEVVTMKFFDTEEDFKKLRKFILLDLKETVNGEEKKASAQYQEEVMGCWLEANKNKFEPLTVKQLLKSSAANRNSSNKKSENSSNIKALIPKNEVIDLTDDSNKPKNQLRRIKRRKFLKSIKIKICKNTINDNEIDKEKQKITYDPSKFISRKNFKKLKRSKSEFQRIRKRILYENNKEFDNCFLYSLRGISDIFSFDCFIDYFRGVNIDLQIELANQILEIEEKKSLKKKCVFRGTLESIRECVKGKLIVVFLFGDSFHCESINEGQFNNEIQKEILEIKDEENSFDIYSLC